MKRNILTLTALLLAPLTAPGEPQRMEDVARIPAGQFFRLEHEAGKNRVGDSASLFANGGGTDNLAFDVSNLRVLGNLGAAGQLKAVTIYRDSYRHCAKPEAFLGANRLPVSQAAGKLTVVLLDQAPDPTASVICLETDAGIR